MSTTHTPASLTILGRTAEARPPTDVFQEIVEIVVTDGDDEVNRVSVAVHGTEAITRSAVVSAMVHAIEGGDGSTLPLSGFLRALADAVDRGDVRSGDVLENLGQLDKSLGQSAIGDELRRWLTGILRRE